MHARESRSHSETLFDIIFTLCYPYRAIMKHCKPISRYLKARSTNICIARRRCFLAPVFIATFRLTSFRGIPDDRNAAGLWHPRRQTCHPTVGTQSPVSFRPFFSQGPITIAPSECCPFGPCFIDKHQRSWWYTGRVLHVQLTLSWRLLLHLDLIV